MNLFHLNSGVNPSTIKNSGHDIHGYTTFIKNAVELLKRETYKIEVVQTSDKEIVKYSPKDTTDKKKQKLPR